MQLYCSCIFCLYDTGLQISGHSPQFNVGDTVTITCSFDLSLTSIMWLYDDVVAMSSSDSQLNLTFSPVNDTIHNRQYTCRVTTPYGEQEENITISVQGTYNNGS